MTAGHDKDCPCTRFDASWEFCNCEAGQYGNAVVDASIPMLAEINAAAKKGWRRKIGSARKVGFRTLNRQTPHNVHKFATTRLNDIAGLLQEIEMLYGETDMVITQLCEAWRHHDLPDLQAQIDERLKDDLERETEGDG
ncbi:hypothetical protein ACIQUB_07100 [Rhizobium sp. NPDC090275]|uniref:hypothetical protein n=1 Tax=Rhizobium sp. NPDC090275 TaxID=3364498 RepID=UPI00383B6403